MQASSMCQLQDPLLTSSWHGLHGVHETGLILLPDMGSQYLQQEAAL